MSHGLSNELVQDHGLADQHRVLFWEGVGKKQHIPHLSSVFYSLLIHMKLFNLPPDPLHIVERQKKRLMWLKKQHPLLAREDFEIPENLWVQFKALKMLTVAEVSGGGVNWGMHWLNDEPTGKPSWPFRVSHTVGCMHKVTYEPHHGHFSSRTEIAKHLCQTCGFRRKVSEQLVEGLRVTFAADPRGPRATTQQNSASNYATIFADSPKPKP